jgi:hypothetical protein
MARSGSRDHLTATSAASEREWAPNGIDVVCVRLRMHPYGVEALQPGEAEQVCAAIEHAVPELREGCTDLPYVAHILWTIKGRSAKQRTEIARGIWAALRALRIRRRNARVWLARLD